MVLEKKECYNCANFNPYVRGCCDLENKYEGDGWTHRCLDKNKIEWRPSWQRNKRAWR